MNKRDFVVGGCTALVGVAVPAAVSAEAGPGAVAALRGRRLPDLATDQRGAAWQAYVGHRFEVRHEGRPVALTLDEVRIDASALDGHEQFTLRFSSGEACALGARTHVLAHRTGQRVAVYLDAGAAPGEVSGSYRAHFSLIDARAS
ncbi:DUF6916 family protein [Ideonella sp. A 288]|uniref:DUF6916 family protein n=1 Tax=Ideonella sp. A 288 TaxID=1962181 RepID=UPI000B4BAA41|nr:hypothetical protein [Ideonella sp. A 288]